MAESKSLKTAVKKEVAEAATEASTGNVETRKAPPEPKGDHVEKIARSRR